VDICIDNLQHFTDFKRLSDLKEQRDKGTFILKKFSISDQISDLSQLVKDDDEGNSADDYHLKLNPMELEIDPDEIEEARSQGMFEDLPFEEEKLDQLLQDQAYEENKEDYDSDD